MCTGIWNITWKADYTEVKFKTWKELDICAIFKITNTIEIAAKKRKRNEKIYVAKKVWYDTELIFSIMSLTFIFSF